MRGFCDLTTNSHGDFGRNIHVGITRYAAPRPARFASHSYCVHKITPQPSVTTRLFFVRHDGLIIIIRRAQSPARTYPRTTIIAVFGAYTRCIVLVRVRGERIAPRSDSGTTARPRLKGRLLKIRSNNNYWGGGPAREGGKRIMIPEEHKIARQEGICREVACSI